MIDSVNFIIYEIIKLNLQKIINLGITYRIFQYRRNDFGNYYRKYGKATDLNDKNLISQCIEFEYNNILFQYYGNFKCIVLIANAHRVLQKADILLSDRNTYIDKVKATVSEILDLNYSQLNLHRIDYCIDLFLDYNVMYEYLHLLNKHKSIYANIKRINEYETSIYLTSKYGQKRINIYDKYHQAKEEYYNKYKEEYESTGMSLREYKNTYPSYYEYYRNIFRIEVQNTKVLIKKENTSIINKYENDITKQVNQLEKEKVKLEKLIARKDKIDKEKDRLAKQSIYESIKIKYPKSLQNINISDLEKEIIEIELMLEELGNSKERKEYIADIETTIDNNRDKLLLNKNLCAYWNKESMQKYYFDFLKDFLYTEKYYKLKKAKQMIKHESSFSGSDKIKLQEFITAVNQYGITNVTKNSNKSEYPKWCGATVTKYMNDLEELGINVVALDSTNNKDRIKSARDKINKSNHTQNWKSKLNVFVSTISKYGVANVIAKNNSEITDSSRNIKHKRWSGKTVEEYIKKLESIGLNPVTLNNNSKFESLESLYKLIKDKANKEYFDIDKLDVPISPKPKKKKSSVRRDRTF